MSYFLFGFIGGAVLFLGFFILGASSGDAADCQGPWFSSRGQQVELQPIHGIAGNYTYTQHLEGCLKDGRITYTWTVHP